MLGKGNYKGGSSLFTLLYTIVRNCCVDFLRKNTSKVNDWVNEMPVVPDRAKNILEQLSLKEGMAELKSLMEQAGTNCRQVLIDSLYFGYKVEEIAERQGLKNAQTVSSIKSRCLSRLRKLIAQHRDKAFGS